MFLLKKNTILGVLLSVTIVGGGFYLYNLKKLKNLRTEDSVDGKVLEIIAEEEEEEEEDLGEILEESEDAYTNENSEDSDKENNSQKNNIGEEIDEGVELSEEIDI